MKAGEMKGGRNKAGTSNERGEMFSTELSMRGRCSHPSLKVALLGSHLAHWAGGNDFLRLCAGGVCLRQLSFQVAFSVFVAGGVPVGGLRRPLGPLQQPARARLQSA